jgi:hypothetical protein
VIRNKAFVLGYRIAALVVITAGLMDIVGVFAGNINWYIFFAYTIQSNVLVWLMFVVLIAKTATAPRHSEVAAAGRFGFYPVVSFAVSIAILITMLIFWAILAPMSWSSGSLLTFSNLAVHLVCPLLMLGDRVMFYGKGVMRKREVLSIAVFPYIYIAQSFTLGLTRAVYFEPLRIESYYIYPFLDFDAHGYWVFLYIALLTVFFLGIGYLWWWFIEKKVTANRK